MSGFKNIQWFPGHMAKAKAELKENLKEVDLVAEILDSRIPISSRNPDFDNIIASKPRIIVLNKTDLSGDFQNKQWINFYKSCGFFAVPFSLKNSRSVALFTDKVMEVMKPKSDAWKSKGMIGRSVRIMVVGIPNVGKSSFINKLCKNSKAKVENRPGVTRKNQWFDVDKNIQLLDTPGVLWPKFENENVAYNLAFTGAIKEQILDIEDLALKFIEKIKVNYSQNLAERFKLEPEIILNSTPNEILQQIGRKRGMLISGGEVDMFRTSNMIFEEFRSGKLGRITLEIPK